MSNSYIPFDLSYYYFFGFWIKKIFILTLRQYIKLRKLTIACYKNRYYTQEF